MYLIADDSMHGSPNAWATAAIVAYHKYKAGFIVAEVNNGGEMVTTVIHAIDPHVPVKMVTASRGKATRAEPISAHYEKGHCHHVGSFPALEDEQCLWIPGDSSPNRMDALVWAGTELLLHGGAPISEKQPTQKSKWATGGEAESDTSRWNRRY
jgi:phage terminase large subunit-like protein